MSYDMSYLADADEKILKISAGPQLWVLCDGLKRSKRYVHDCLISDEPRLVTLITQVVGNTAADEHKSLSWERNGRALGLRCAFRAISVGVFDQFRFTSPNRTPFHEPISVC
jgi:hypothetical protein